MRGMVRPAYSRLTFLILRDINLHSIEILAFVDCSMLEFLNLDENYTLAVQSLYKTNWKRLNKIYTKTNVILEIDFGNFKTKIDTI
jgi:hypothetical protein